MVEGGAAGLPQRLRLKRQLASCPADLASHKLLVLSSFPPSSSADARQFVRRVAAALSCLLSSRCNFSCVIFILLAVSCYCLQVCLLLLRQCGSGADVTPSSYRCQHLLFPMTGCQMWSSSELTEAFVLLKHQTNQVALMSRCALQLGASNVQSLYQKQLFPSKTQENWRKKGTMNAVNGPAFLLCFTS